MLCEYGCGQEAKYQFGNGKWCCSLNTSSCPMMKQKIKKVQKNTGYNTWSEEKKQNSIQKRKYWFSKNKEFFQKISKNRKFISNVIENINNILCDYGCGKLAKYHFPNLEKYCCGHHFQSCPSIHNKSIKNQKYIEFENNSILCDYGCGKLAKYTNLRKDKFCCTQNWAQCSEIKRKNSNTNKIKQSGENNARYGIKLTNKTKQKIRLGYIKDMQNKFGQVFPNYNKIACKLIEEYGNVNNYNFQHAENGGEFFIKELGYWVDGYDKEKNTVIEVDESFHYNNGILIDKDIKRQKEIEEFLECKFIRIPNF